MADDNKSKTQGGTHEQHVKAGQQSHKNQQSQGGKSSGQMKDDDSSSRGKQGGQSDKKS